MFVDHIKIHAKAGDGGNGCSSFRREKYVPKGGPDGGDGGQGGDVIIEVSNHTDNLREFFFRHRYKAEQGKHGQGQRKTGKSGKDLILKVPPGTMIYLIDEAPPGVPKTPVEPGAPEFSPDTEIVKGEGELALMSRDEEESELAENELAEDIEGDWMEEDGPEPELDEEDDQDLSESIDQDIDEKDDAPGELIADLTEVGQRFVLCEGGVGGKGNWNFRTDTNQAPLETTPGTKGEEGTYLFELRKIADVGLVGFPNAGKSTLLGALSNAAPKVAAYPFTTLKPMVGVVDFPGFYRATIADIPGLIEGAHRNVGLGHDFLRHISRCSVFLFVVDCAAVDQRDPISDIQILRKELRLYDEELGKREWLIVANKIDLEESEIFLEPLRTRFPKQEIFAISAETGKGLDELKKRLCEMVGVRPA